NFVLELRDDLLLHEECLIRVASGLGIFAVQAKSSSRSPIDLGCNPGERLRKFRGRLGKASDVRSVCYVSQLALFQFTKPLNFTLHFIKVFPRMLTLVREQLLNVGEAVARIASAEEPKPD